MPAAHTVVATQTRSEVAVGAQAAHSKKEGATQTPEIPQQCLSVLVVGAWHSYLSDGHSLTEAHTTALVTVGAVKMYSLALQLPLGAQPRGVKADAAAVVNSVAEHTA